MKAIYHIKVSLLTLAAMVACTEMEINNESQDSTNNGLLQELSITGKDFQFEDATRSSVTIGESGASFTWDEDDVIGIFPDKGDQVSFAMDKGAGTQTATFSGGGWALKSSAKYAAYYPHVYENRDMTKIPVSYVGQTQNGNANTDHIGAYDFMAAGVSTPENGAVAFDMQHLGCLVQLKITVPQPTTLTSVKLVAETDAFALEGKVDITANVPSITPVTSAKEIELVLENVATTEENQVVTLYMMLPPMDLSEQTLKAAVASDKGTQEIELVSKNFQAGKAYGLSGKMESPYAGFEDGIVTLAKAGTMKLLLGDDWLSITSLKVVGPIDGDDVHCLRQMLGGNEFSDAEKGKLASLDLSDVIIVKGGDCYYKYSSSIYYYTSNDVIGNFMFYKCANLKDIVLSNSLTSIGQYAFSGCSSLTSVDILDGITSIGDFAFSDCPLLTSISMGTEITLINDKAFSDCPSISSVHIRDLSAWCKITFTTFYSNPLYYGAKLYLNNQELTELVIPEEITEIKDYAFTDYSFLTSVTIGDGVTSIGKSAFYDCSSLTSITMGNGVISIGDYAFFKCSSLTSITMSGSVTSIGQEAFYKCSSLATIVIPNGVTLIDEDAFYSCSSLKSVHIRNLSAWCNITFSNSSSNPLYYGARLYLNDNELTELIIPTDIKQIKDYAFYNCESVKKITVGEQITSVGIQSFRGCSALTQVYCQGTTPPTIDNSFANSSFNGSSDSRTLYVLSGGIEAYQNSDWAKYFKTIKKMD